MARHRRRGSHRPLREGVNVDYRAVNDSSRLSRLRLTPYRASRSATVVGCASMRRLSQIAIGVVLAACLGSCGLVQSLAGLPYAGAQIAQQVAAADAQRQAEEEQRRQAAALEQQRRQRLAAERAWLAQQERQRQEAIAQQQAAQAAAAKAWQEQQAREEQARQAQLQPLAPPSLVETESPPQIAAQPVAAVEATSAGADTIAAVVQNEPAEPVPALAPSPSPPPAPLPPPAPRRLRPAPKPRPAARNYSVVRVLMCNDGTESPTCTCGGPHRGCCSHHGGIDGCASVRVPQ